jgi:hypothetical protein
MHKSFKNQIYKKTERYLTARGLGYTPEQIEAIVKSLYELAEVDYQIVSSQKSDDLI